MKAIFKTLCLLGIAIMLASCAGVNLSDYQNVNGMNTNVELSQNNYKIVKQVQGEYSAFYVFGIGGFSKKALNDNARAEMLKNADLKDGQAVINVTTTHSVKTIVGLIYMKHTAVCTGTVIEFTK